MTCAQGGRDVEQRAERTKDELSELDIETVEAEITGESMTVELLEAVEQ